MTEDKKVFKAKQACVRFVADNDKCSFWDIFQEGMKYAESPSKDVSVDDRNKFRVLKYGWIYIDVNRLADGLYQALQPVLYPKDYTTEKILQNHKELQKYTGHTDEYISRVEEALKQCKMVDVSLSQYSIPTPPADEIEGSISEGEETQLWAEIQTFFALKGFMKDRAEELASKYHITRKQ